jgi:general secretion pathway protein D
VLRHLCIAALFLAAVKFSSAQAPAPTAAPARTPRVIAAPIPSVTPARSPAATTTTKSTTTESSAPQTLAPPTSLEEAPYPPPPSATPIPDKTVVLQYPNSDVADVLHLYETLTGKRLVMDNFVQGKVTIFISKPVPREEAIKIIEMNLLMNGYSLIPAEGDILKVIGTGKNPRGAGVPIISDDSDIPSGDHVISFLFKLRYADPIELQQVLGQYLPPSTYTSFLALPKSSSILVTENSSVIRSLVHIIEQVDIPPAEVVSEFIKLERADATKVVEMLKDVFEKGTQTPGQAQPAAPGVRPVRPAPNVPAQVQIEGGDLSSLTALTEDSIVVGKIKISADIRTNRIHVITRPINMPFVHKLIAEFDANVEFGKPVTRPLRYISAADVLPVLVQALTEPGTEKGGGDAGAANPNAQPQQQRRPTSTASSSSGGDSSSSGGSQGFSEELSTQAVDTTPKAVTIGNAKIIADQRANAIIVLGNREVVVKVSKILDEMDVRAPQVALSTVIGELTINNETDVGFDYFAKGNKRAVGTTSFNPGFPPFAGGSSLIPGSSPPAFTGGSVFSPGGSALSFTQLATNAAGGANVYLAAGNTLAAVVHLLDTTGRFKVISRPMVFTSNNKKAIIASGTEIPVPVSTLSSLQPTTSGSPGIVNNFGTQSSIQFKKVALQLEVVPLINSEKEVTLDILQKLDSVADSTNIDGNLIPNIATRYIKTTVSAENGSTIILGGLITDNKRDSKTGIPLLSKIPLIGGLFRETSKVRNRTELIVLMRPEVALTKLDLFRLRQKSEDRTHFGPELNQDDCPDCPKPGDGKQLDLPAPDLPGMK